MEPIQVHARAKELYAQLKFEHMERAYKEGVNFSAWLEKEDPSSRYQGEKTDAFQRMMEVANIRTRGIPGTGIEADTFEAFNQNDQTRVLGAEYLSRCIREVRGAGASTRNMYISTDQAGVGSIAQPWATDGMMRRDKYIEPDIPISALVARTVGITGTAYRALYLQDNAPQQRMVRVGQSTVLPTAAIKTGEKTVDLYKFGRAIEWSYEDARRMPIDLVREHLQVIMAQIEVDKLPLILEIMVSGDGNANTAAINHDQTVLHTGSSSGTLTLRAWQMFKKKFKAPYRLRTILGTDIVITDVELLNVGNANITQGMLALLPGTNFNTFRPINPSISDQIAAGWTDDAPASKIVGIDPTRAVERIYEVGSNISEFMKWIKDQTNTLTISEIEGYAKVDQQAVRTLNIAA